MKPRYYILAEDGRTPVVVDDVLTWGPWFESGKRILRQDQIGPYFVSTVFLGLDHNWGEGPPILWETMVFTDGESISQDRYATYESAERGHRRAVEKVRLGKISQPE